MGKTTWVQLRVNEEEKARIERLAGATGESVSSYLRRKALEEEELAALRERMAKMEAQLEKYADLAEQYDNLDALLANPRFRPLPG